VSSGSLAPSVQVAIGTVPEGKVADFLTGRHVRDTPEEYVRQNLEKALVRQYRFAPADCAPEVVIRAGSSKKRVDIAVFGPGLAHAQENIRIIVETKRAGTSPSNKDHGIGQLKSYMAACLNAQYGIWTNGDDKFAFAKRVKGDGTFFFDEIIDVPASDQTEADAERPRRRDLKPATADNLLFAFRRCHNYIAGTEGKQKSEAFWELLKLIFCKIEDERSRQLDFYATPAERNDATAAGSAKARLQKVFETKVSEKYPTIFQGNDSQIDLRTNVVAFVVSQLQSYSLLASPVDVKGVAYEEMSGRTCVGIVASSSRRATRAQWLSPC
jgi:type I restriction enzyme M protein